MGAVVVSLPDQAAAVNFVQALYTIILI